ncbi:MAG: MlaD family protein [Pseudomonadota bacterium]
MTAPPDLPVKKSAGGLSAASIVWLVPLAALVIALGVAWQNYSDRGPLIEIAFPDAAGMNAGETALRYRDVDVGLVEDIRFSDGLANIIATVRVDKDIEDFIDDDARFWIVQPEVTTRGVTGLETVLSGVFIEGDWDTDAGGLATDHTGLAARPLASGGEGGLRFTLNATPGTALGDGTPILFKGIEVGRVGAPELDAAGTTARAEAIIFAPYDDLVTANSRFWDTSGFTFSLGAGGAEIDFTSIASLIGGGVTFETFVSGGQRVQDGTVFALYPNESRARASLFTDADGDIVRFTTVFRENVAGLAVEAPVELDGVVIGEVENIRGIVDPDRFGDDGVRLLTTLALRPGRLGLDAADFDEPIDYFADRVAGGLRARLATASILTGGLKIELVDVTGAREEVINRNAEPHPVLPSTESNISDVSATAEGVLQRINELPIEELLTSATRFLQSATRVASNEDLNAIPGDVRSLLGDVRGVVGGAEVQALPAQAAASIREIEGVASDLRALTTSLTEAGLALRLQAALDAAASAAQRVEVGVAGVPALVMQVTSVAERAEALPLDALITELTETVTAARALVASEDTRALPASLSAALAEVEAALAELREGGAVANLNTTLASASDAAAAVETAVGDLPDLAARIERLIATTETTIAGFGENAALSRDARAALRDIQGAAEAVESLARALERRPNSVILGR